MRPTSRLASKQIGIESDTAFCVQEPDTVELKTKGAQKILSSKVTLHLDQDGLITKHDKKWDHKENLRGMMG